MDKRLLRVTFNEHRWEKPSKHKWKKENQGNSNIAYENQYGFGGEEWLFNQRYNIGGYQYGYIRGLSEVTNIDFIDEAFLYAINTKTKDRFLIAKIKNIELLEPDDLPARVSKCFQEHKPEMVEELKEAEADFVKFNLREILPVVKFKISDATIFDVPIIANELKADRKYNRFKPYLITDELGELLKGKTATSKFAFIPGIRNAKIGGYQRKNQAQTTKIVSLHNQITKDLEAFLKQDYQVSKKNLSIETTVFGGNIADVVLKEDDETFSILEVKTSHNTRYNIREALGQLVDYALWQEEVKIKRLVIISPSILKAEHSSYFKRIQSTVKIPLEYWQYCSSNPISKKFIKIL